MKPAYLANRGTLASLRDSFDSKTWYERLNLLNKLKRFCQICTGTFSFWCLVAIFTLLEPLLCSNKPVGFILLAQVIVLGVSSLLYIIQLIGVASREWDKIVMIQALSASTTMIMPVSNFTPLKLFIFFSAEGEYILEFCCLVGGWATIFFRPGLAVLRCFRVFRLLWYVHHVCCRSCCENTSSTIHLRLTHLFSLSLCTGSTKWKSLNAPPRSC